MVEFETIESTEVKFGNNNFIEIGKKKAITDEGENVFISLSRGFFTPDNERRYKKNFALPNEAGVIKKIIEALQDLDVPEGSEDSDEEAAEEDADDSSEEEEE